MMTFLQQCRASAAIGRGDYSGAAQLYTTMLHVHPSDTFAESMLALCNARLGRHDVAIATAVRLLEKKPASRPLLRLLTECYVATGDYEQAYRFAGLALSAPPLERPPLWSLALLRLPLELLAWSRGRNVAKVRRELRADSWIDHDRQWTEWAIGFKRWYDAQRNHDAPNPPVHPTGPAGG